MITSPAAGGAPRRLDTTGDPGFCTLWSLVGFPTLTLPIGLTKQGVPLGLQVIGRAGADAAVLSVAAWIEQAIGPIQKLE